MYEYISTILFLCNLCPSFLKDADSNKKKAIQKLYAMLVLYSFSPKIVVAVDIFHANWSHVSKNLQKCKKSVDFLWVSDGLFFVKTQVKQH